MKKIEFKNLPDKTTPINSTNLNKVQDNIEEVFEGNESMGSIVVEDVTCKNLFDTNDITQNATITKEGAIMTSSVTNISGYISVKAGQQYTFSYNYATLLGSVDRGYVFYDLNKTYLSGNVYNPASKKATITPTQDGYVRIGYDKNCYDVQLEKGTVTTDYTSHKKFSYNSTNSMGEIVVDDINCKNLLDFNSIIKYNRDLSATPTVGNKLSFYNSTSALQFYIPVKNLRGKTLTYSNNSKYSTYIRISELDDDYKFIKSISRIGFTIGDTTSYLCVILKESTNISTTATDIEAQLEKGSIATEYIEHKEYDNSKIIKNEKTSSKVDTYSCSYINDLIFKPLRDVTDMNNIKTSGIFTLNASTNVPAGTAYYNVAVFYYDTNTNYAYMIATKLDDPNIYVRYKFETWQAWKKIVPTTI